MKLLNSKRIWAVIIAIAMVLSIVPAGAAADAVDDGDTAFAAEAAAFEEIVDPELPAAPEEAEEPVAAEEPEEPVDAEEPADDDDAETDPIDVTVTITGRRETFVYDGEEHTAVGYDVSISDPAYTEADFVFNGTAQAEGVWAREYPMGLAADQFENTKPEFASVTFIVVDGMLTITRRPVTIESESATKVYDGIPLENPEYTILGEGFAANEMPMIFVIGSVLDVGKVKNKIIVSAQNAIKGSLINTINLDNYQITLKEGTLEVTPKPVTVTADNQVKKYGAKDPEFTASVKGLLAGDAVQYTVAREKGEAPGAYAITPVGETLQGNYRLEFQPGTLQIQKRPQRSMERFTLAWFSDARIAADGARADALEAMVGWTVANAETRNIIGLFGTGSLVGTFNDAATEARGVDLLSGIRARRCRDLRYYAAAGAIDVNGDEMNYGPFANRGVRGASVCYRDGEVWVQRLFDTGVMAVGIGYHKLAETEEELEAQRRWIGYVNDRIASAGRRFCTILFVNDYVDETGKLTPFGELIESGIVAKNPGVRLVLSSCAHGAVHTEAVYGDRTVNVLAFHYAEDEANGLGYLRLLTFDPKTHDVEVSTYSPVSDRAAYSDASPEADTFTIKNAY